MELVLKRCSELDIENIFLFNKHLIDTYENLENIDYEYVLRWISLKIEKNIHEYTSIYLFDQLVGYYRFHEVDDKMELDDFFVIEEYRNKGIGTAVLKQLIQTNKTIFLYVFVKNIHAIRLYERFGFKIIEYLHNTRCVMER